MGKVIHFKKKQKQRAFVSANIERWIFEDDTISWAAKGVLAWMMATYNGSGIRVGDYLALTPPEHREQARKAIDELTQDYINLTDG